MVLGYEHDLVKGKSGKHESGQARLIWKEDGHHTFLMVIMFPLHLLSLGRSNRAEYFPKRARRRCKTVNTMFITSFISSSFALPVSSSFRVTLIFRHRVECFLHDLFCGVGSISCFSKVNAVFYFVYKDSKGFIWIEM